MKIFEMCHWEESVRFLYIYFDGLALCNRWRGRFRGIWRLWAKDGMRACIILTECTMVMDGVMRSSFFLGNENMHYITYLTYVGPYRITNFYNRDTQESLFSRS
jgi:hypothetical protein